MVALGGLGGHLVDDVLGDLQAIDTDILHAPLGSQSHLQLRLVDQAQFEEDFADANAAAPLLLNLEALLNLVSIENPHLHQDATEGSPPQLLDRRELDSCFAFSHSAKPSKIFYLLYVSIIAK